MSPIQGITPIAPLPPLEGADKPDGGKQFDDVLTEAIGKVEQYRIRAEDAADGFLRGETEEIHQVILAGQRAEIAFEAFLQVRNKAVQAYQEIMRMQL